MITPLLLFTAVQGYGKNFTLACLQRNHLPTELSHTPPQQLSNASLYLGFKRIKHIFILFICCCFVRNNSSDLAIYSEKSTNTFLNKLRYKGMFCQFFKQYRNVILLIEKKYSKIKTLS